jgi:hypothetical protein
MILFFLCHILIIGTMILSYPKDRHMQSIVPILIAGAFGWSSRAVERLRPKEMSSVAAKRLYAASSFIIISVFFIFFSGGPLIPNWQTTAKDIAKDIKTGGLKIMESRPYSLKASFKSIGPLIQNRRGILTSDHRFIGAFFTYIPISTIYDVAEIPPFGYLGKSDYKGLKTDRIDCIMISHVLATESGIAPNLQIRYQNYIKPYIEELRRKGAKIYDIKSYGQIVLLEKKD